MTDVSALFPHQELYCQTLIKLVLTHLYSTIVCPSIFYGLYTKDTVIYSV